MAGAFKFLRISGLLSYFPRALKVRWTFAQRGPKWNGLDLRFLRCILHRLRRNADWMWERTLICQNQRMRDSHNAHRRRKKRKKDIPEP